MVVCARSELASFGEAPGCGDSRTVLMKLKLYVSTEVEFCPGVDFGNPDDIEGSLLCNCCVWDESWPKTATVE